MLVRMDMECILFNMNFSSDFSVYIAQFPEYTIALINHLMEIKVVHWDWSVALHFSDFNGQLLQIQN